MSNPAWVKGVSGNPRGRTKGAKNKFSLEVREAIFKAFFDRRMGGYAGFIKWAKANRTDFYCRIVGRFIPQDIDLGLPEKGTIKLEMNLGNGNDND